MPIAKAEKIVGDWKANGYNKSKTLMDNGYAYSTSRKAAHKPIDSALKVLAQSKANAIINSPSPSRTIMDTVGYTADELIGHYRMIIEQNKDLSNKLKALMPLLSILGIKWNEEQTKVNVPILNITTRGTDADIGSIEPPKQA